MDGVENLGLLSGNEVEGINLNGVDAFKKVVDSPSPRIGIHRTLTSPSHTLISFMIWPTLSSLYMIYVALRPMESKKRPCLSGGGAPLAPVL